MVLTGIGATILVFVCACAAALGWHYGRNLALEWFGTVVLVERDDA